MKYTFRTNKYARAFLMISFTSLIALLNNVPALASGQTATAAAGSLPPIDKAAPSGFATASFGLG